MENPFQDAVVVSTYTDREACEDGILVPISPKDRVTRAVWEYLVSRGPKGSAPPSRWPVDMLGWFQASKMSKPEALALIAEHGTDEANKKFARMIADRKALALSKGIISTHARQAARVYEENTDGGIYKLFSLETAEGITELAAADPGERSGKTVLWLLPNENGGTTLMFPEDY